MTQLMFVHLSENNVRFISKSIFSLGWVSDEYLQKLEYQLYSLYLTLNVLLEPGLQVV